MIVLGPAPKIQPLSTMKSPDWLPDEDDGVFDHFYKGIIGGFLSLGKGITGTAEWAVESFTGENEFLSRVTNNIRAAEARWTPTDPDNALEWTASAVGRALPIMGSFMVGGAGGGAVAGRIGQRLGIAALSFSSYGQSAYEAAKSRGVDETTANRERAVIGAINGFLSISQIGRLLKLKDTGRHSLNGLIQNIKNKTYQHIGNDLGRFTAESLTTAVNSAFTEFLQEGVSTTVPGLFEGKEGLPLDPHGNVDYSAIATRMGTAALAAGVVTPILGAAGSVIPGKGYDGMRIPEVGKLSLDRMNTIVQKVQDSSMPQAAKEGALGDIYSMRKAAYGIESPLKTENAIHQRLAEKTKILDETLRPPQKADIKRERGLRAGDYRNQVNELTKAGMSETEANMVASGALKGEMVKRFAPFLEDGFTTEDMDFLRGDARKAGIYKDFELKRVNDAITKLFQEGKLPEPNELNLLEPLIGKASADNLRSIRNKQKSFGRKFFEGGMDVLNMPRATMASWDMSPALRQGGRLLFADPKAWIKGVGAGYRAMANENYAKAKAIEIRTHPLYALAKKSGLFEADVRNISKGEEAFTSTWADTIPGVKPSRRMYTTMLNTMRHEAFYNQAEQWIGTGKTPRDYAQLGKVINHFTGRGDLGPLEQTAIASVLNVGMFSPRLAASLFNTPGDVVSFNRGADGKLHMEHAFNNPTRMYAAKTLVSAFGTGMSILGLAYLASRKRKNMKVEVDPRSGDFGKVVIGNTRIDYWGGYAQIMRTVARMATGEMKSTSTGEVHDMRAIDAAGQWIQSKLSPSFGLALDMYRGEDFKGDPLHAENLSEQFFARFLPMFLGNTLDAVKYQGMDGLIATSALGLHGVGAMTYPVSDTGQATNVKNALALQTFGKRWNDLGPEFQTILRDNEPAIEMAERKAQQSRWGRKASAKFIEEQRSSERHIRKGLSKELRNELDRLVVPIGGLSRHLGSNWFLNDQRYQEYQMRVISAMNQVLPYIALSDMPDMHKQLMIQDVIDRIKRNVRQQIMWNANVNDLFEV